MSARIYQSSSLPDRTPNRYKQVNFSSLHSIGSINSTDCGFGFSKLSTVTYQDLLAQYKHKIVEGLYAIVIPSGGGKTSMAALFKQLDVDLVLPDSVENYLKVMRVEIHRRVSEGGSTGNEWRRHNLLWAWQLSLAIKCYNFKEDPRVIFVHSPETACQIGARVIGVFLPTIELHKRWMMERCPEAVSIGHNNRELLQRSMGGNGCVLYSSGQELAYHCAKVIANNIGYAPGLCRHLPWSVMTELISKSGSDPTVHARIRNENANYGDIDSIIEKCKTGRLPWWHVGLWCERHCEEVIPDGGHKLNNYPWLHLSYSVHDYRQKQRSGGVITRAMLNGEVDWFSMYPYMDGATLNQGNVTMRSLIKHTKKSLFDDYSLKLLSVHIGAHHSFVVSVLVYYLGVVSKLAPDLHGMVVSSGILEVPEEHWVEVHTEVHKLVRSYQSFFGRDLNDREYARLQYTACLYGRRNYALDPGAEIAKRRSPRLLTKLSLSSIGHNQEEYVSDFRAGVEKAYYKLGSKKRALAWDNMDDFFEKRYQWAASGSVTNLPDNMKHLKEVVLLVQETKGIILHLGKDVNKKILMEKLRSPAELAYYLTTNWGYNDTGLAPKPNEPAKKRVLMPGSFLHYVAMSYILGMVERTGDVGGVRIGDPEDNALSHFDLRLGSGTYNFMLDFADHNAQHSSVEMSIIIACLEERFSSRSDPNTLKMFVNWVVSSFFNMKVRDGPYTHSVLSGLYTGWRGTTWINSVACQAYVNVGIEAAKRRFGGLDCLYFEGAGDDVMMRFGSATDAFKFYRCMSEIGYDMQSIKQLLSHTKTEFLRVIGGEGGLRCCINRVLPNYVSGDLERSSPGLLERVGGAYATTRMLLRRGLDHHMVKALYASYMDKWLRVKIDGKYEKIDRAHIHGIRSQGGSEIPDENDAVWILNRRISVGKEKPTITGGPRFASKDYARVVCRELMEYQIQVNENRLSEILAEGVYSASSQLSNEDLLSSGTIPEVKAMPLREVDLGEYERAILNSSDALVASFKQQWGRYNRYKTAMICSDISRTEFMKRLGISIDIEAVERFQLPAYSSFTIPEYVLYNFGMYYRSRVAYSRMEPDEARCLFELAANAACEIMRAKVEM
uniref:RNA-directed RNA polymerase n=1 Tax=Hubei chryso-like virus 2 TaxID=1922856 RepID=A0A1L3KF36_9VIRU|nr:hypothetical protein [Hubei chryso-like virus 2]